MGQLKSKSLFKMQKYVKRDLLVIIKFRFIAVNSARRFESVLTLATRDGAWSSHAANEAV